MSALRASAFAAMLGGFAAGWQAHVMWDKAMTAQTTAAVARVEQKQAAVAAKAGADHAKSAAKTRVVYETLVKEVPVYVPASADDRCVVPLGFVRLHDAAAQGVPAPAPDPGEPADAPSGVALSAVASTVVANYGTCASNTGQLVDLIALLRKLGVTAAPAEDPPH